MNSRQLEVVFKDNKRTRLTITPTRITIKLQENLLPEYVEKIVTFCKYVSEQPQIKDCNVTLRGEVDIHDFKFRTELYNDSKSWQPFIFEQDL